jgi:D-glycero-D-manno-heptose 1,7-bisphosphate phosphatase
LALRAAADLDLDLGRSYMVGDKAEDVRFGLAMGAVPVLVLTGYGLASRRRLEALGVAPAAVAADLGAAVDWILARELGAGR